jgi:hypothetical protein
MTENKGEKPIITRELEFFGKIMQQWVETVNDSQKMDEAVKRAEANQEEIRNFFEKSDQCTAEETSQLPKANLAAVGETLFFGYGANIDKKMVENITGMAYNEMDGQEVVVEGYNLCVQTLNQVEPREAKNILDEAWQGDFSSYTIRPGEGKVKGKIWKFTPLALELMRDWELIDFHWRKFIQVPILLGSQRIEVWTEMVDLQQSVESRVNGLNYEPFINHPSETWYRIAQESREDAISRLERLGVVEFMEGKPQLIEITSESEGSE